MSSKKSRTSLAETPSLLSCSNRLLDNHLQEILEEVEEIRTLAASLRGLPSRDKKRDDYEAHLWVALTHLDHHVKPAIREWDRVLDRMPDD